MGRLTREQEREIVRAVLDGQTHASVAKQYGVHRTTITRLVSRTRKAAAVEARFYAEVVGKVARNKVSKAREPAKARGGSAR